MDTQVRTPQLVFMQPQRFIVPLFQRPYVWNEENQWDPLWQDVVRVAERLLAAPASRPQPHFLGAVVLQQMTNSVGSLQTRTIIDGQQRLTTLELLLNGLYGELLAVGAEQAAMRIEALVANPRAFCELDEDRFKVWPTNRDRAAFNDVMAAVAPINYQTLKYAGSRLAGAHRYFSEQARVWLNLEGADQVLIRAEKLEYTVRELLQLVVIDLDADENAQEIFETLNARGAQLTPADLIKNFVFQKITEQGGDVEAAYEKHWKEFETGFWEAEVSFGRLRYSRSSIFLNHLLIARTGKEVVAREVFSRFKSFAEFESEVPMSSLLEELERSSRVYKRFIDGATALNPIDRVQLFAYRTSTLESEVFKPVVLWLFDPEQSVIPENQSTKALEVIESWLVRRMLVRATSKAYNQVASELIAMLRVSERSMSGDLAEEFFAKQNTSSRYWPDDTEVISEIVGLLAYKRLRRARLRMVLEAIEDFLRGWKGDAEGLGGERVPRSKYQIEHIMPRSWVENWPVGGASPDDRDRLIHTFGNLTLLTSKLNAKVSNSAWTKKKSALDEHNVLKMNSRLLASAGDTWTDQSIRERTVEMARVIVEIWKVPVGHVSTFSDSTERQKRRVTISDLIGAGLVEVGATLYSRGEYDFRSATILSDGRIDLDGETYDTPSGAAKAVTGQSRNGWWFWLLDPESKRTLTDIYHQYVDQTDIDTDEEVPDNDDEDDQ